MRMTKPLTTAVWWVAALALTALLSGPGPAPAAAAEGNGYRLGAGDVVKISILAGGKEQAAADMVVGDAGDITVPFVGKIQAAGLTITELEKQIVPTLARDYFVNPQVHLQIQEYRSLQFFISGTVESPGVYSLDFIPTLMDLIAKAGGVTDERGNQAYILRGVKDTGLMAADRPLSEEEFSESIADVSTKPIVVDLQRLLDEGDMSGNIMLESGDTVYIPQGTRLSLAGTKIYVEGKVKRPGLFDYQPGITALGACIMAGGFDKFAAPNRARVIRTIDGKRTVISINLRKVQTGEEPDLPLEPGDHIHIPESWF
jgi:polysaccharide export outer membrane protein